MRFENKHLPTDHFIMNSNAVVVVTLVVSVVLSTGSTIHESNPGPEPNSFKKLLRRRRNIRLGEVAAVSR